MTQAVVAPDRYEHISFSKSIDFKASNVTVKFIPENNVPGFTYKVLIIREGEVVGKDWLRKGQQVSNKSAEFFYNKHINGIYAW